MALAVGHSAVRFLITVAAASSPVSDDTGTSFRQSIGHTSTQPLHMMHNSPSKMGLIEQIRQRPPCSCATGSSKCSSTSATPMRRLTGSAGWLAARPAQVVAQRADVGVFAIGYGGEEPLAHDARLHVL